MTQVDFHFNVPSRMAYVCRLLRKVVYSGHRVLVLLPHDQLDALDGALWSFSQEDFIAHARCEAVRQVPHSAVVMP
jgi:DNA polymerase-3 subunit chi